MKSYLALNSTYLDVAKLSDKVGNITKATESFTYSYDGTLLTQVVQDGILQHTTDFTYNNNFEVTSATYAGATQLYTYDNDGLLITSGDYNITRDPQNAYTTNLTDGTITQTRAYNSFGELTQLSDNTFAYSLTQRDNTGAITQKTETLDGVTTTYDYTFDNRGRLTQVQKDNTVVEEYTYDNNGNRQSATVDGTTITASYTLDDNLVTYGNNTYLYDEDGYLKTKTTPDGSTTYSDGTLGELLSVTTPTKTITYKHNASNQRVAKLVDGVVTEKYLWANLTTLLAIYKVNCSTLGCDANNTLMQRFEYADSRMPISMTMNGDKYYLHYDQVGSLRAVADINHNILKEVIYDTFGNILNDTNQTLKLPFGFAGGLYDVDTKLTRFGYRDYDAYSGKWTAKDPIWFAGRDSNLYGYVLGDPVSVVDPTGEIGIIGGAVGGVFSLGTQLVSNNGKWGQIDWYDVVTMAIIGAVAPSSLASGLSIFKSSKALRSLSQQLSRSRTANKKSKLNSRINKHINTIGNQILIQGGIAGVKYVTQVSINMPQNTGTNHVCP